jgi:hypothetical protein
MTRALRFVAAISIILVSASAAQAVTLTFENFALNGDVLALKIRDAKSRVTRLAAEKKPHDEIVDELYLAALSRLPSDAERTASRELLAEDQNPAEYYQDLLWALLNSKQFLFVH